MLRRTGKQRKRMSGWMGLLALWLAFWAGGEAAAQDASAVFLLDVDGAITPIVRQYILRGLEQAESENATALVIRLDTPGGSVDVTKEIVQRMAAARAPIVVYVAPAGAHAASAGTFITLAGHLAAMAPGTTIGAASPVSSGGEELGETAKEKAVSVLEADLRGLAARRGEQAEEWAALAVREAKAATNEEALELGVIDLIAADVDDLLRQLDGRNVNVAGVSRTLHTAGVPIRELPLMPVERLLHVITDPNIAFILMTIGLNGILFELSNPGSVVPGVVGGICLLLALYALGVLSVNYAGLLLVGLAFVLFIVDVKAPTHGVLTVGGIASFILGSMILFNTSYAPVSIGLVITVAVATGAFFAFVVAKAAAAMRRQPTTGSEGLIGQQGVVRQALSPEGMVLVAGELWRAHIEAGTLAAGASVRVLRREGFRLVVEPLSETAAAGG